MPIVNDGFFPRCSICLLLVEEDTRFMYSKGDDQFRILSETISKTSVQLSMEEIIQAHRGKHLYILLSASKRMFQRRRET